MKKLKKRGVSVLLYSDLIHISTIKCAKFLRNSKDGLNTVIFTTGESCIAFGRKKHIIYNWRCKKKYSQDFYTECKIVIFISDKNFRIR